MINIEKYLPFSGLQYILYFVLDAGNLVYILVIFNFKGKSPTVIATISHHSLNYLVPCFTGIINSAPDCTFWLLHSVSVNNYFSLLFITLVLMEFISIFITIAVHLFENIKMCTLCYNYKASSQRIKKH